MAPKRNASAAAPAAAPVVTAPAPVTTTQKPKTASPASANDWNTIISNVVDNYQKTPQRTKLIDVFLAFLVVVGIIQFVYCLLITDFVRQTSAIPLFGRLPFADPCANSPSTASFPASASPSPNSS
jgi:oligosaccharyltransferase complex subunit epsilon